MRPIDADALQERLARMWTGKMLTNTKYHTFSELISAEPTIDAEPVVRCKDCIYNTRNTDGVAEDWCYMHGIDIIDGDNYCSHGERIGE